MWQGYLSLQERGECFSHWNLPSTLCPVLRGSLDHSFISPVHPRALRCDSWKRKCEVSKYAPPPAAENPWHGERREALLKLIGVCWCRRVCTVESSSCVSWIIWVGASGWGVMERVEGVRLDKREKVSPDTFHPAQEGRKAIRVSRAGL